MIFVNNFLKSLKKSKIKFFTGVPDSVLKNFSSYLQSLPKKNHLIATNEGSAVSIGIGYYLATKKMACVYMQNSGLSNAINPLISIADKKVYSIPLMLVIGWRGSPKIEDEPQHMVKGKITKRLLKLLKIKFCVLRKDRDLSKVNTMVKDAIKKKSIIALLIEKNTLKSYSLKKKNKKYLGLLRSEFISTFLQNIPVKSKIISTTGYTSRELMQIRNDMGIKNGRDFYMVGGMGHSSSVTLGLANYSKKKIFCLDGDGSILMHLGSLKTIGHSKNKNLKHIMLNNNSHESVGGQPTYSETIDFKNLVMSLGYKKYFVIKNKDHLKSVLKKFVKSPGPSFLEVKITNGSLKYLQRPKNLIKIKDQFLKN